jgi:intracellular sulfur oxidation DsrE/DsrF family protein
MFRFTDRAKRSILLASAALLVMGTGVSAQTSTSSSQNTATKQASKKDQPVKISVQVSDNDPRALNLALNNVRNALEFYASQKKTASIEVVAYGPGLHMLRSDTSPVKDRVAEMSLAYPNLTFSACRNTMQNMQKQEGKDIPLVSEAKLTDSGVVRLVELQSQGYAYVRP